MDIFKESHNIIVFTCNRDNITLRDFVKENEISSRLFRRLYRNKHIYVNGQFLRKDSKLKKGDRVSIYMEDEENNITPEKMDLDIIYEDHDLLVLNKEPFMVVHTTSGHQSGTLSNGVSYYFKEKGINMRIRFVNRLDRDTSGVLIVAKNPFAHQQLALQLEANSFVKKYYCIVEGVVEGDEGTIDFPIGREEDSCIERVVTEDGQEALTKYRVVERYRDASLLEVQIFTGRTHQIRVHMNHIGHPIVGDSLYNKESPYIKRQALHSCYLKAVHPRTKEDIEFIAPLPADIKSLINLMKD